MKQRFKDITGFRFGKLTVIEMATTRKNPKNIDWVCKCDCGNMTTVIGTKLRKENGTKSCGCLINENRFVKHNMSKTREYHSWSGMLDRCYNANSKYYHLYGGRGIEMCPEWKESFNVFYEDMGACPETYSIDRINNDGNYEPSNCRWATKQEQSVNRKNTVWIEYEGELKHLAEWARVLGISSELLSFRVTKFGVDEAFTMPFGRWGKREDSK